MKEKRGIEEVVITEDWKLTPGQADVLEELGSVEKGGMAESYEMSTLLVKEKDGVWRQVY